MKLSLPKSTHNWVTLIGATVAAISISMIVFLFTISVITNQSHTYLGLIIYIILPMIMIIGLILIPVGMYIQSRKEKLGKERTELAWPKIDLNTKSHRNAFFIFSIGTTILLFASAIGSYEAFHYSESNEFCGQLCHSVMHPEYTAYQNSAHARVACVECHVGEGADWYVRSKLSGAYQVYATLVNNYPKPIPTPISNLRPARETCEQCHWPQKFYARKLRVETHYLGDDENTQWDIQLLMKIGGEKPAHGLKEGIHWHINPNVKIEYIASDDQRTHIPWVRYTNQETGEQVVFLDEDEPLDEDLVKDENIRTMDCMDCHTRPSHNYQTPVVFINQGISKGLIPQELPEIKYLAVDICDAEYSTNDSAMMAIEEKVTGFYQENYPEIAQEQAELITQAINGIQAQFSKNIFPEMKVRWDAYPNNIGHMDFNGCFRCHNNTHSSESGEVISMDCNACHLIIAQGPAEEMTMARVGEYLEFEHPDGGDDWKYAFCTDCHTGVNP